VVEEPSPNLRAEQFQIGGVRFTNKMQKEEEIQSVLYFPVIIGGFCLPPCQARPWIFQPHFAYEQRPSNIIII